VSNLSLDIVQPLGLSYKEKKIEKDHEEIVVSNTNELIHVTVISTAILTILLSSLVLEVLESVSGKIESYLSELKREWPEIFEIYEKLRKGETLNTFDMEWIDELSKETGWSADAVMDEIKNLDKEPSTRVERYQKLFEEYYKEAKELREKKDYSQAGEKLWGAVTALIKLYAAKKGIRIEVWDHAKLFKFINNNFSDEPIKLHRSKILLREAFYELLSNGNMLHKNFYENELDEKSFDVYFNKVKELIDAIKKIVVEK